MFCDEIVTICFCLGLHNLAVLVFLFNLEDLLGDCPSSCWLSSCWLFSPSELEPSLLPSSSAVWVCCRCRFAPCCLPLEPPPALAPDLLPVVFILAFCGCRLVPRPRPSNSLTLSPRSTSRSLAFCRSFSTASSCSSSDSSPSRCFCPFSE